MKMLTLKDIEDGLIKMLTLKAIEDGLKFIEKQFKDGIIDKETYDLKKNAIYKVKESVLE